jgi:uncharacterized protein YndB with AHSA1/START domain
MMMILHELPIQAPASAVYNSIVDETLIGRWWLKGAKIAAEPGAIGTFPLSDGGSQIKIRLESMEPGRRVVWRCLVHKHEEWIGTVISFEIAEDNNSSVLTFRHEGWADTKGVFGRVSFYWASLYLTRLKNILEGETSRIAA